MGQRYYLTLVGTLLIGSSLIAMEKGSPKPVYSIELQNSTVVVTEKESPTTRLAIKKAYKNKKLSDNGSNKPNPVTLSPNNMHRVFQQH